MSITFRRHYWLLLVLVLVVVLLITLFRNTRIIAYTVAGNREFPEHIINYDNGIDIFDDTVVHEVVILISEEDQDKIVTTYQETGEKDYFSADIIIDGVRINNVGIRLKGNASLRSLGGMFGGQGGGGDRPGFGGGAPPARPGPGNGDLPAPPSGGDLPAPPSVAEENPFAMNRRPGGGGMPMGGGMSFGGGGETGKVPYLVKFDEYVEGQRYQGYAEIALRTYGISYNAAQLQEPVSNYAFNNLWC